MRKKLFILFVLLAFAALCNNVFAGNQYPFEVKVSGSGKQALIFIPGFACSGDVWNETLEHYNKDYKCYTITLAGFAGTAPQAMPSLQACVTGIAAYIKDNKITQPVIIGHSMGGGMAMLLGAGYPGLISKIVVVDALPCLGGLMDSSYKAKAQPDCSAMAAQMEKTDSAQFHMMQKMTMMRLMADTAHREAAVQWSMKSDRRTFGEMYCQFLNTDMRDTIAAIKAPALILLEPSFAAIKPQVEGQYKKLKTANLQYANKGLHFIMFDDKEWYLQQMDGFLKQ